MGIETTGDSSPPKPMLPSRAPTGFKGSYSSPENPGQTSTSAGGGGWDLRKGPLLSGGGGQPRPAASSPCSTLTITLPPPSIPTPAQPPPTDLPVSSHRPIPPPASPPLPQAPMSPRSPPAQTHLCLNTSHLPLCSLPITSPWLPSPSKAWSSGVPLSGKPLAWPQFLASPLLSPLSSPLASSHEAQLLAGFSPADPSEHNSSPAPLAERLPDLGASTDWGPLSSEPPSQPCLLAPFLPHLCSP